LYVYITGKAYGKIICLSLATQDVMAFTLITLLSYSCTEVDEVNF